jgi:hypothetical protein
VTDEGALEVRKILDDVYGRYPLPKPRGHAVRERIEFRIPESLAERYLPADCGRRIGIARSLHLTPGDAVLLEVKRIEQRLRARGGFFTAWEIQRRYSRRELESAELLHVYPRSVFEPAGEDCGTEYDDSKACAHCGAGAVQTTALFLDGRRIPRGADFSRTIADEIVVSARVVGLFEEHGLTGARFDPVRLANRGGKESEDHFQLRVVGRPVELDPSTRAGDNLFDEFEGGRCQRGDLVGLNLLSEVAVQRATVRAADVLVTRQMVGVRRGLLKPQPILLCSPRAWRVVDTSKLRGLVVEVAHLR